MKTSARTVTVLPLLLLALPAAVAGAAGLRGSLSSMTHQHDVARTEGFTFLRTQEQLRALAEAGKLEAVPGNAD